MPDDEVRHFDLESGLPQSSITALLSASDGFLWIGTYAGLARFDGRRFAVVAPQSSYRILSLAEGAPGELWVGTEDGGLSIYKEGAFTRVALNDCRVGGLARDGRRMIAATSAGLFAITDRVQQLGPPAVKVVATSAGRIFVAGRRDVWELRGETLTPLIKDTPVATLALLDDAPVIEIKDEQYRFEGTAFKRYAPLRNITYAYRDLHGALWMSDAQGGMYRELIPYKSAIKGPVSAVVTDAENLWIGTAANGLYLVQRSQVAHLTDADVGFNLPGYAVISDGEGGVYTGINCDGIRHIKADGTWRRIEMGSANGGCPWSMLRDDEGVWVGNTGGQLGFVKNGASALTRRHEWQGTVRALAKDKDGLIASVDEDTYRIGKGPIAALHGVRMTRIVPARAGGLWFLGDQGALRVQDDQIVERWDPQHGLTSRFVRALYEDGDALWIGTYGGGLHYIHAGSVSRVGTEDTASCFVTDKHGALWMSGNRGIRKVTRDHLTMVGRPTLEANGAVDPACVADEQGRLWFSLVVGFAVVLPTLTEARDARAPLIERLTVAGQDHSAELPVEARNIEIHLAAPALSQPSELQLRVRLDEQWMSLGDRNSVMFPQLPWGTHTFEAQARLGSGAWSPSATLTLHQARPWYRTPAAFIAGAVLLVMLTLLVQTAVERMRRVQRRVHELAREKARLEVKEKRDADTTLLNTRGLQEALAARWEQRVTQPLTLVLFRVDERRQGASALEQLVKEPHLLAATPDAIAALLVGLDRESAVEYAQMLQQAVQGAPAGWAISRAGDPSPEALFERAQEALASAAPGVLAGGVRKRA